MRQEHERRTGQAERLTRKRAERVQGSHPARMESGAEEEAVLRTDGVKGGAEVDPVADEVVAEGRGSFPLCPVAKEHAGKNKQIIWSSHLWSLYDKTLCWQEHA